VKRPFAVGLAVGVLAGLVAIMVKVQRLRRNAARQTGDGWGVASAPWTPPPVAPAPPPAAPFAPTTPSAAPATALPPGVDPVDGACPTSHPVKAKRSSKLFHLPGMAAYERTKPDRCYVDAAAAEADGFTRARR